MEISKNILLKISKIVFLIVILNFDVNACSCEPISFKDALEYADEIFVGKIVKAERFNNGTFINADKKEEISWDWRYYFQIRKKWKGNNESELIVHHEGTSCDLYFDIYQGEYLVYASRKSYSKQPLGITYFSNNAKENLSTWLCSRTMHDRTWEEGNWFEEDIEKLEKEFPEEIELKKPLNMNWFLLSGILIITIGIYLLRRIKKKN
jgi:LPXTG-motif cell wall-anchored protein